ncbi:MAG TPA: GNAT family N-acetyltransferase [Mycobacteriales bacterium]|nr:GNAT family N-acetyltransferase [Mycobacteriales bacterium]
MEPVSITAGRLHLRPWEPADVDVVLRGCVDRETQRWAQVPRPYTRAHAEDFVGRHVPKSWADGSELFWAVCDAATGVPLASISLHAGRPGVREIGFWCLPEARGAGVVTAAAHAVARWAFAELGLVRLEWAAEVGNAASLRVAVKAGFTFEGRRRASLRPPDGSRPDGWWAARLPGDGPDGVAPALPDPGTLTATTRAGDALRLRRWQTGDVAALTEAVAGARDALRPRPGATPEEQARWWVTERSAEDWAAGVGAPLAVLDDAGPVGSLQLLLEGRRAGVAEVGVWIAPRARRRGTAVAAITAMLAWAEPALGLARVEWHAAAGNAASLALADQLGFVREGVARAAFPAHEGQPRGDSVVLARLLR